MLVGLPWRVPVNPYARAICCEISMLCLTTLALRHVHSGPISQCRGRGVAVVGCSVQCAACRRLTEDSRFRAREVVPRAQGRKGRAAGQQDSRAAAEQQQSSKAAAQCSAQPCLDSSRPIVSPWRWSAPLAGLRSAECFNFTNTAHCG
ncbi:hypothetical protein N431DRAFT_440560 [Stipitochalara longipes BDJ]|nr:hypothetical protein N431DRAFT_440560 [Stipitochalara longipes BDJ]